MMSQTADYFPHGDQASAAIGWFPSPEPEWQEGDRKLAADWSAVFTPETYYGKRGLDCAKCELVRIICKHLQNIHESFVECVFNGESCSENFV